MRENGILADPIKALYANWGVQQDAVPVSGEETQVSVSSPKSGVCRGDRPGQSIFFQTGLVAVALLMAAVLFSASVFFKAGDVHADAVRLTAAAPMFDASVLPTPWWVERHSFADDELSGSAMAEDAGWPQALDHDDFLGTGLSTGAALPRPGSTLVSPRQPVLNGWTLGSYKTRWQGVYRPGGRVNSFGIDFSRQLLPESSASKVALGLGWALIDAQSGARGVPLLSLKGSVALSGRWSLYGQSAWLADTGEIGGGWSGDTLEAGLSFNPSPDLSLRAGYRRSRIRLGDSSSGDGGESSSIIFGAGFRW